MKEITRGAIFYADLDPIIGSEQQGFRPVLILQNDIGNKHSPTTIIAPISTKNYTGKYLPTHIKVTQFNKIRPNSIVLLEQIRTIDKQRLKGYICNLSEMDMNKIEKAILISLGYSHEYLNFTLHIF